MCNRPLPILYQGIVLRMSFQFLETMLNLLEPDHIPWDISKNCAFQMPNC